MQIASTHPRLILRFAAQVPCTRPRSRQRPNLRATTELSVYLLKDPADHFSTDSPSVCGRIACFSAARAQPSVLKRAERAKLLKAEYQRTPWSGSLRQEVQRIDRERGTTLALTIDRGLQAHDRVKVETTFREVFAILLDDLLFSIQHRLAQSATVGRALQHARRFYAEGLDAHLSINAPEQAARASFALDAMARAIEEFKAGKSSARDWFARERGNFMRAINEGLGPRIGRRDISAPAPIVSCPANLLSVCS